MTISDQIKVRFVVTGKTILVAPNVFTGGGLVLLAGVLGAWPKDRPLMAFLDARAKSNLKLPPQTEVYWVVRSVASRLAAEVRLFRTSRPSDTVLCFHGLPPLLPCAGRIVAFVQNSNFIELGHLSGFAPKVAMRLAVERFVCKAFRRRVHKYIVQTPTMRRKLKNWFEHGSQQRVPAIAVVPFMQALPVQSGGVALEVTTEKTWDFVYVSDGVGHKNHRRLLAAWRELADAGIRPTLALTLPERDRALIEEVDRQRNQCGIAVYNLGIMQHNDVLQLYRRCRAMIFPSLAESFGLPLIEAYQLGVPIVASERDFVREVCLPAETFDPQSEYSIALAVRRFLDNPEQPLTIQSPAAFVQEIL